MTKYIFITGGVVSGIGKGITAASLGRLLKERGLKIGVAKLDPYMNVDPGTMSPFQHGEVFVTDDGTETDLDLGHYERFIDENVTKDSSITSGKIFDTILKKERSGGYLGNTVQVVPHVTTEIKDFIYNAAKNSAVDVFLIEIGGTIGDIEGQPFVEAIRQIALEKQRHDCLFMHVTLVPYLKGSGEHKSKPTQRSVRELMSMGITPTVIIARADEEISPGIKDKIALFCNVERDCVIEAVTSDSLYQVPLLLNQHGLDQVVCRALSLDLPEPDLSDWRRMTDKIKNRQKTIKVAIVGKYVSLADAYLSIIESLNHAGFHLGATIKIIWVESNAPGPISEKLKEADAIIVPGGFGIRGVEGKIAAVTYARENNVPFLGICLGMQLAVIEFARHVCQFSDANSTEFDENTTHPVVAIMTDQVEMVGTGGTMRLGAYPCKLSKDSLAQKLYGQQEISERHRHRFEFNNDYRKSLQEAGLVISGVSPDHTLVEIVEIPNHKFFIAVQYHPEFKSRPNKPHPLFLGLLKGCL